MIRQILREEGIHGFYKGLSASYLSVTESTIQWLLYERLKRLTTSTQGAGGLREWVGMLASVGTAMCVASLITYPHEVRHLNTFFWIIGLTYYLIVSSSNAATTTPHERDEKIYKLNPDHPPVIAEESARLLYGGLSAHLMRVVLLCTPLMKVFFDGVVPDDPQPYFIALSPLGNRHRHP